MASSKLRVPRRIASQCGLSRVIDGLPCLRRGQPRARGAADGSVCLLSGNSEPALMQPLSGIVRLAVISDAENIEPEIEAVRRQAPPSGVAYEADDLITCVILEQPPQFTPVPPGQGPLDDRERISVRANRFKLVVLKEWTQAGRDA